MSYVAKQIKLLVNDSGVDSWHINLHRKGRFMNCMMPLYGSEVLMT